MFKNGSDVLQALLSLFLNRRPRGPVRWTDQLARFQTPKTKPAAFTAWLYVGGGFAALLVKMICRGMFSLSERLVGREGVVLKHNVRVERAVRRAHLTRQSPF